VPATELSSALCHRRLVLSTKHISPHAKIHSPPNGTPRRATTPSAVDQNNVILRTQSAAEAVVKRDALATALYAGTKIENDNTTTTLEKQRGTGTADQNNVILRTQSAAEAVVTRDALATALYAGTVIYR